jgi:predicted transcriptional regulator
MIKELPEEEVNKLMGDINNDTTMAQKHALVDKMMNHADLLKTYHEGISKVFTNNFQYRPDARDEEGKAMTEYYLAYESTKEDLIKSKYAINDRKSRLNDIAESIFKTHERLTPDIVHSVTTYGGLESLKKQYSERSTELFKEQEELGHAKGTADSRTEIRKERATLDTHIGNIERYVKDVNEKKANLAQQAEIFQSLASFEMNGRDPSAERIDVETSDIVGDEGLLQKGFDIDNLKSDINDANALINHLYTEKGFKEWMDTKVFLASEGKRQLQEAKEKGTVANIVQAGEKSYQTGHKYVLQKGMEIPKVTESKDTKGISKFFTKDYWGGINATKIFKSKEEAEVEATKDAETFAKELGTVTITGRELDGRGNIEVKTEDGKTYHIDPALLANHIATETPQEIVDAPERQELNNFVEEYNEKEALTNSKYKTVENVIHEEETGTTETADKIIDDLEIKDIYDAIENREESLDEFTKDARKVVDLMDAKGLSKAEIIDSLNCL